jgi:PAS domain S-box-containing protein
MKPNQTINGGFAAQFLLGGLALGLVSLAFFWLRVDFASTAFVFLLVIFLFSLMGSFAASALLTLLSVVSLIVFFVPPINQFKIDDPQHLAIVLVFLITSLVVTRLIANAHKEKELALEAEAKLRQSQAALRDSETQWREVFEHNPVMYFMVDATGTVLNVNTFGAAQLGYSVPELVGQSVLTVFLEGDREFVRKCVEVCLQSVGRSHTWEIRKIRKDGSTLWVRENAKAMRRPDGELVVLIACEDITERKETENALRQSEQRFRDYAETASDWLWETGSDHRVTHLSEHTNDADMPASAVTGMLRWEIASDAQAEPEKWVQHRSTLDAHLPFRDLVYRSFNRTGSPVYVRTSGKPFFDANGGFLGYRGVSTDITATIRADQAEQALRKAQAELAHVTRVTTLGELTASIAHEINQPLAALLANAEACLGWLDRATPDLAAARRSLEWIVDDSNRASEVIRRVRALAKKTDIDKAPLDINTVATEAMALVQRELASHAVSLRMELEPRLPRVFGDRVQLQQVIINLAMNGIEAMQSVVDRQCVLEIRSGRDDQGRVLLAVSDCGVGIASEETERLFAPFFTTKARGLGMGLSICRSIVEAHEGQLYACRNDGPGATFQFTLPLYQEDT